MAQPELPFGSTSRAIRRLRYTPLTSVTDTKVASGAPAMPMAKSRPIMSANRTASSRSPFHVVSAMRPKAPTTIPSRLTRPTTRLDARSSAFTRWPAYFSGPTHRATKVRFSANTTGMIIAVKSAQSWNTSPRSVRAFSRPCSPT